MLCALVALKSSTQEGYSSITIIERRQLFNLKEFSDPKSVTLRKEHTQAHPQPYLASAGPACNLLYNQIRDVGCPIQTSSSAPSSCRPNYFIAGTRKGGTTSLHTYMSAHPRIFPYKLEGGPQDGESKALLDGSKSMYNTFTKNLNIPDFQLVGDSVSQKCLLWQYDICYTSSSL